MTKSGKYRLVVELDPIMLREIDKEAKRLGLKRAQVARVWIREGIDKQKSEAG